jgi:UDP-2,3-diacylglucosamine pyrophosphatase LpxH
MIILSDLHLGDGGPADDFGSADDFGPANGPQDRALVEFLREHRRECIILAGDTADLAQASEAEIKAAHPLAVRAIVAYAHVLLRGNHDDVPVLFGRPTREAVLWSGTLVMHGHQFDPINYGRWRLVGKVGSWAAGWLERTFGANADVVLDRWLAKRILPGRFGDPDRYRRRALRYIRRVYGAERIVLGHTHTYEPSCDASRYANSGTWTNGRRDVVVL